MVGVARKYANKSAKNNYQKKLSFSYFCHDGLGFVGGDKNEQITEMGISSGDKVGVLLDMDIGQI